MKFIKLDLPGAVLVEPELLEDERGFFARTYCREEFQKNGMNPELAQCSTSFNWEKGTLRGMHYQKNPHEEAKLVRCTMGAIYDVIIDLRNNSPTYKKWISVELSAQNRKMLYIPEGFAHGFQTLEDNSEVFYQISSQFVPGSAHGLRWNDEAINIKWPMPTSVISLKDQTYPAFQ